jgi:ABC-type Fe3+-hydroxamate transport system substrate-binding protein
VAAPGAAPTALLVMALAVAACGVEPAASPSPAPLPSVPGQSHVRVVSRILDVRVAGSRRAYRLANGQTVTVDSSAQRIVSDNGGNPEFLVVAHDDAADWFAVIGHQEGTPEGCLFLNQTGYELGDSIVIVGVRWQKGPALPVPGQRPEIGFPYPDGTRFCLDEQARVSAILAP